MPAVMSATLSSRRRSVMASTSMPSMPSVPLISASPSFSARTTGSMPAAAKASAVGSSTPLGVAHHTLAQQRQRAVGERSKITGTAETAVLVHHRRDPGVDHGDIGLQGLLPDPGATGGERRDAQQGQGAHHLPLDLGPRAGGVRTDQAALQPGAQLDRDVPGGQGPESGGDAVVRFMIIGERLDHRSGAADLGQRLVGDHDRCVVPGYRDHLSHRQRSETDHDRVLFHGSIRQRGRQPGQRRDR